MMRIRQNATRRPRIHRSTARTSGSTWPRWPLEAGTALAVACFAPLFATRMPSGETAVHPRLNYNANPATSNYLAVDA